MSDKKKLQPLLSDKEAIDEVENIDLSEYDLSEFKPVQFEFLKKSARLELRLPEDQLVALKRAAKERGMPYTRLVRQFIEQGMKALHP